MLSGKEHFSGEKAISAVAGGRSEGGGGTRV